MSDDKPAYTIYCSAACGQRARPKRKHIAKTCLMCGTAFKTRHKGQVCCSKSCGKKMEWAAGKRDHLRNRLSAARFDAMFG